MAVSFFLTPFVVRTLGDATYGIWVVLLALVGYASILELGIQRAIVKLVAENRAVGRKENLDRLVSTAFFFFFLAGLVIWLFSAGFLPMIIRRLFPSAPAEEFPRILFFLVGADVLIIFLGWVFTGILYGCQLYHTKNLIEMGTLVLNAGLVFLLLARGGITMLMAVKSVTDLVALSLTVLACRRALPGLTLRPSHLTRRSFAELFSFAGRVFVSSTVSRIATYAQPLIIGTRISAASTTFFAIPKRLVDYVREIHWAMATGFMPMFSDLHRRGEFEHMRDIYARYSRYILMVMLPVVALVGIYGPSFIGLWIGSEYASKGRWVLWFLTLAYAADLAQPLLWSLFIGVGHLDLLVWTSIVVATLTIVGSIVLAATNGIVGVAFASFAGSLLAQIVFTFALCRFLEFSFLDFARRVYLRSVIPVLAVAGVALGSLRLQAHPSYGGLISGSLLAIAAYVPLVYLLLLDRKEKAFLGRKAHDLIHHRKGNG